MKRVSGASACTITDAHGNIIRIVSLEARTLPAYDWGRGSYGQRPPAERSALGRRAARLRWGRRTT